MEVSNQQDDAMEFEDSLVDELFPGLCIDAMVNSGDDVESELGTLFNIFTQFDNIDDDMEMEVFNISFANSTFAKVRKCANSLWPNDAIWWYSAVSF